MDTTDYTHKDTSVHAVGSLLVQEDHSEFLFLDVDNKKLNYLYRYTKTQSDFTPQIIYPQKNLLSDHDIKENKPDKNKNYIPRLFKRKGETIKIKGQRESCWQPLYEEFIGLSLEDLLLKQEKLILLQSKGGSGKTATLIEMYHFLQDNTQYHPLFLKLRSATLEKVREYLNHVRNDQINKKIPFLLLDGLDEFPAGSRQELLREIFSAIEGEPEGKILVSARENALSPEKDFICYELKPFTLENMVSFSENLEMKDTLQFIDNIKNNDLLEMAKIPFYLELMANIFIIQ